MAEINTNEVAEMMVDNSSEIAEEVAKKAPTFWENHPNLSLMKTGALLGLGVTAAYGIGWGLYMGGCWLKDKASEWKEAHDKKVEAKKLEKSAKENPKKE